MNELKIHESDPESVVFISHHRINLEQTTKLIPHTSDEVEQTKHEQGKEYTPVSSALSDLPREINNPEMLSPYNQFYRRKFLT